MPVKTKYSKETIAQIVAMREEGETLSRISEHFGISYGMIAQIVHRDRHEGHRLTFQEWVAHRERMQWLLTRGVTVDEVAKMYRVLPTQIESMLGLEAA